MYGPEAQETEAGTRFAIPDRCYIYREYVYINVDRSEPSEYTRALVRNVC